MSGLTMPKKGGAAQLLADLNAEHAPLPTPPPADSPLKAAQTDRQNDASNKRYNVTTLQETFQESNKGASVIPFLETNVSVSAETNEKTNAGAQEGSIAGSNAETFGGAERERGERLQKALQIASDDELDVATIRVSAKLHAYLERYVERINRINPKAKYRKQDAIEAAFAGFYADHPMPPAPAEGEEL